VDPVDLALRRLIYARFGGTGARPTRAELAADLDRSVAWIDRRLERLADRRMVVLGGDGEIAKALPFSAEPTDVAVEAGGVTYYGNCAWDAFGLAAVLGPSATIALRCGDCGEPVELEPPSLVHFAIPAARWWDDIAAT
jgi:hypothetical protein